MEKNQADALMPLVMAYMDGNIPKELFDPETAALQSAVYSVLNGSDLKASFDQAPAGSVAVIPVMGVLQKDDFCGALGTASMAQMVQAADQSENIVGIVLKVDSGGGQVVGTENLSDAIYNTSKPVVAHVDGAAGSAAYWIASAADEIMMAGKTSMVGSIGTMVRLMKDEKALENRGYEVIEIYADKSTEKNKAFSDAKKGDFDAIKSEYLNPLNEIFHASVQRNRGQAITDFNAVTSGKMYLAEQATENGLADTIGSFEMAVARVIEMAGKQESKNNFNHEMSKIDLNNYPTLSATLGVEAEEKSILAKLFGKGESTLQLDAEQLEALETALAAGVNAQSSVDQLEAQVGTLKNDVQTITGEKQSLKDDLDAANTRIKTLEENQNELPGAINDGQDNEGDKENFLTEVDQELKELREEI